jgi:phosphatidylglycerophosphate synthase
MPVVQHRPAAGAAMLVAAVLAVLVREAGLGAVGLGVGVAAGVLLVLALDHQLARMRVPRLGPADRVTLVRAALSCGVAALVGDAYAGAGRSPALLSGLAAVALALDGVDGRLARRTATVSAFGAKFDGEADAFLIAILSAGAALSFGPLVVALGAARYVFLLAGYGWPWMRGQLPFRYWRKIVTAAVGIALLVAVSRALPTVVAAAGLLAAALLLGESFGRDVWWLWRRRSRRPATSRAIVRADPRPGRTSAPTGMRGAAR